MIFPIVSIAADEIVTIKFEDEKLYNAIVEQINKKIENKDDSTYTIQITKENLNSITSLHFSAKGIRNISGIEKFEWNNINNIDPIKKLVNLKILRLDNNNITDISALTNLINLEELGLRCNNISNLEPLSNLNKLKKLNLGRDNYGTGNPISTLKPLENLTNLIELKLAMCNIKDISALKNMNNLTKLDLMCNQIGDISDLSGLTKLNSLQLWGNKIKDITPLKDLTNLTSLDVGYNEIMDMSILEEMEISWLSVNSQKATINVKNNEQIELPKLFLQAKDPNSKIYTNKEWKFTNCKLSEDGKYIILEDNSSSAKVTIGTERYSTNMTKVISDGAGYCTLEILISDTVPPDLEVQYSTKEMTNETVTITANEKIQQVEGWLISSDRKKIVKEYENNVDKEKIIISDMAGNIIEKEITISNIDKTPPELEIVYSELEETEEPVIVLIKANEKIKEIEGWTLNEEKNELIRQYNNNVDEQIIVYDLVGNGTAQKISINNINKPKDIKEKEIKDETVVKDIFPNAGGNVSIIIIGIGLFLIISIIMLKKYKNYKDIK